MKLTVYLADEIVDVLNCYGDLNQVVNKMLEAGANGLIDIMDKPKVPERKGGHYYQIDIQEPNYLSLLESFGTKSSKISLRRLIYWFIENEIYSELDWEVTDEFVESKVSKNYDFLMDLKRDVFKLSKHLPEYFEEFEQINSLLNKIEENLWDV